MNKINWKIRLQNKAFWITLVPALLLTAQRFADLFGFSFTLDDKQAEILVLINSIFVVLAVLGVVIDPTVSGFADSQRALEADAPIDPTEVVVKEQTADEIIEEVLNK